MGEGRGGPLQVDLASAAVERSLHVQSACRKRLLDLDVPEKTFKNRRIRITTTIERRMYVDTSNDTPCTEKPYY